MANSVEYAFDHSQFLNGKVTEESTREHVSASLAARIRIFAKSAPWICSSDSLWKSETKGVEKMESIYWTKTSQAQTTKK